MILLALLLGCASAPLVNADPSRVEAEDRATCIEYAYRVMGPPPAVMRQSPRGQQYDVIGWRHDRDVLIMRCLGVLGWHTEDGGEDE